MARFDSKKMRLGDAFKKYYEDNYHSLGRHKDCPVYYYKKDKIGYMIT